MSSFLWAYNRSFNYKGTHSFEVACNSNFGNITLDDPYVITNTEPQILKSLGGGYIDFDGDTGTSDYWQCTEDVLCIYNFSANVTDPDVNDVLIFNYSNNINTTLTNFTINSSTGVLTINITNGAYAGSKQVELNVRDSEASVNGVLRVNVTSVNGLPYRALFSLHGHCRPGSHGPSQRVFSPRG